MIKEKAFLLADKLESRGYRQGIGGLKTGPRTHCCLGVACQIAGVKPEYRYGRWVYEGIVSVLPTSVKQEFGFAWANGAPRNNGPIIIDGKTYGSLTVVNDSGVPFKKIAKYIRENWKDL